MEHGREKVEVYAKGAGSGRETAIRSLQAAGLDVTTVKDVTPQAHNGRRPPPRRRGRWAGAAGAGRRSGPCHRSPTAPAVLASGGGSNGARYRRPVQAVPPRGTEAVPE